MSEHPIQGLMATAMSNIKEMVDVNTIIGNPITTIDGTTIVPVSKVSFGFVAGGTDWKTQTQDQSPPFGGGSGGGVSISPIAFLVIANGDVKLLPISSSTTSVDKVIDMMPGVIEKVGSYFGDFKKKDSEE